MRRCVKASADVAGHLAGRPGGLPALTGLRVPEAGRTLRQSDPAIRLVFAGDPARGIAPCSADHGPGDELGAPALQPPRTPYIESQLLAFAQGMRQNDISEQMRTIATQLTPEELHAVAAYYGGGLELAWRRGQSWTISFSKEGAGRRPAPSCVTSAAR